MNPHEAYMTWMVGWADGAAHRVIAERFEKHPKKEFRDLYAEAYEAGKAARNRAAKAATKRFGYKPSILRALGS
jgi:hypothetical protein